MRLQDAVPVDVRGNQKSVKIDRTFLPHFLTSFRLEHQGLSFNSYTGVSVTLWTSATCAPSGAAGR